MFAVVVTFQLFPGKLDAFLPLIRENAATSREKEPGCHQFDVATDPERPGEVFLYELYGDPADFAHHLTTAHFATFDAASADLIASKEVRTYARLIQ